MESVMYANHGLRTHLGESHGVSDVRYNHGVRTHLGESHGVSEVEAPPPVEPGSQGGL